MTEKKKGKNSKGGKTGQIQPRKTRIHAIPDERIAEALRVTKGLLSQAGDLVGLGRSSMSERVGRSLFLQQVVEECKERRIDVAEAMLLELNEEKNLGSITFLLKTLGKKRGYIENNEISVNPDTINNVNSLLQQLTELQERYKNSQAAD